MNTPANPVPESPVDAEGVATAALSPTRPLYWSVRRELWENRSVYIAPLAIAAVVLFGFLVSTLHWRRRFRAVLALDPAAQPAALAMPYSIAATLIIVTSLIVGAFYCLEALLGERRDRSILFWKSLPVSDLTTVLSKISIPLVVLPVTAFAISLATQLAMLLWATAVLLLGGPRDATLWTRLPLVQMTLVMFYGLTVHVLWHAPLYAWLLLVSAWARRTPFLWAVLPPMVLGVLEGIAFQTHYFGRLLRYRVVGAMEEAFALKAGDKDILQLTQLDPLRFLGSPGLWIGLVAAAAFLAAAARLRRYREPI
jgi:ABC-2 type transport system permease protein